MQVTWEVVTQRGIAGVALNNIGLSEKVMRVNPKPKSLYVVPCQLGEGRHEGTWPTFGGRACLPRWRVNLLDLGTQLGIIVWMPHLEMLSINPNP